MKSVFKMLALSVAVALIAGCSDSVNTEKSKGSVNPYSKYVEAEFLSLKQQAGSGDASVQYALGLRYSEGKGVAKDPTQALVWWRKAAEQGNATAQHKLGVSYMHGEG